MPTSPIPTSPTPSAPTRPTVIDCGCCPGVGTGHCADCIMVVLAPPGDDPADDRPNPMTSPPSNP